MTAIRFLPGQGTVNISADVLDPFYLDMPEGESFWTSEKSINLCLPFTDWPKPVPGAIKEVTRWRYVEAVEDGMHGRRVTKLRYSDT